MTRHHRSIRNHAIRVGIAGWADQEPTSSVRLTLKTQENQKSEASTDRSADGWPVTALAAAMAPAGHASAIGER